jgi:hypothetical protein
MDLYIYYKVKEAQAPALLPQVQAMQRMLAREHGVATALKRRPEAQDGRQTWMEIYRDAPGAFEDALARALANTGIGALIDGGRHTETFMDIEPCA